MLAYATIASFHCLYFLQLSLVKGQSPAAIEWSNGPPPEGATSPNAGANIQYIRDWREDTTVSDGGAPRISPFNLSISLWDADDKMIELHDGTVTGRDSSAFDAVSRAFETIYKWEPRSWRQQLRDQGLSSEKARDIAFEKANLFWEYLAEHIAKRILGVDDPKKQTEPIFLYGPDCVSTSGALICDLDAVPNAKRIAVRTSIDASRDNLNPATRTITMHVKSSATVPFLVTNVEYQIGIPSGVHIASPWQEYLDIRPTVGGTKLPSKITVVAESPQDRTFYPDYNLLFVPLRHLVFQGEIENPRMPASSLSYNNLQELTEKANSIVSMLRESETAALVADQLEPFLVSKYYYMFDEFLKVSNTTSGSQLYRDAMIGASGSIRAGFKGSIGKVEFKFGTESDTPVSSDGWTTGEGCGGLVVALMASLCS